MSSELEPRGGQELPDTTGAGDPVPDPGLPVHDPRITDVDERAAKRAERQVATMFGLATLFLIAFVVVYIAVPKDATFAGVGGSNLALGASLGVALLLIGAGLVQWARRLMDNHEVVEERHSAASSPADRTAAIGALRQGAAESQIGRRKVLVRALAGALTLLGVPVIILLGDLGPLPGTALEHTIWRRGTRVVNDVTFRPLRPEDIHLGAIVNAVPASIVDLPEGRARNNALAKAAVFLVRMEEGDIHSLPSRRSWGVSGILCFSKICTHVGCVVNLWEQLTHQLLCPCHQSTFDLSNNGRVVFGPAARSLPQLPIMVDSEGFLVAQSDFPQPVGPSFWERG
ncbi:ubiquinol-cytochrome c reductase iron-sulfur subunit [Actinopolymorpha pittospori]|uniref:Cytochrome bc1 complex Rieske iron-sulfur subunit n=1 Tax=Actinopolymorpha pittospori TaxID=648752 RepID=A0A927MYJ8_9ACTN|nr:Rieske 2Fe-2S domain-containing protein [Actinopolymorpha pittospori]MBE1609320.1 ubiquinol-cytochrome c reductase iron-sulfur subunit [Actinopolymorpha pittospori]